MFFTNFKLLKTRILSICEVNVDNHSQQFRSSDISPQLFTPLQSEDALIHRPVFWHWNWSSSHATQTRRKHIQTHPSERAFSVALREICCSLVSEVYGHQRRH